MNLEENCYNSFFSHIYVEKGLMDHPMTQRVLSRFKQASVIEIEHYKSLFCRSRQDYKEQHNSQKLIIARKTGQLVYKGAAVCQDFGNRNFYYTSCAMNCVYDCEYCFLKGMYPSANIVLFVNIEDIFDEVRELLKKEAVYLSVSYDTDIMALDHIAGFVERWNDFVSENEKLTIEIRTKSSNLNMWDRLYANDRVIYAFTLSPQAVIERYEHGTPNLKSRIRAIKYAMDKDFTVRLCFDPMIYIKNWKEEYKELLDIVYSEIDMDRINDVSVGSFRISKDYIKNIRRNSGNSALVWFPYENDKGVYHYPRELTELMEGFLVDSLKEHIDEKKIFLWEE